MRPLEYAVVGTGNMGRHHARVVSEVPGARLAAVCDKDRERGRETALRFGCPFFEDYREMVSKVRVDAASVAVPTHLHEEVSCALMRRGIHVLVEKPLAADLAAARRMVACAEKAGVKLMVGHVERFNPAVLRLKELLENGRFGKVISLNIRRVGGFPPRVKGANVLLDLAVHDVDVANYLLESCPTGRVGHMSRGLLEEQEDNAVLLLRYGDTSVFIEVNWITPVKIRTLDITGTFCFGRLDYLNQRITLYENSYFKSLHERRNGEGGSFPDYREFMAKSNLTDKILVGLNREEPLRREILAFLQCIRNDEEPPVSGREAMKVLEIVLNAAEVPEDLESMEVTNVV